MLSRIHLLAIVSCLLLVCMPPAAGYHIKTVGEGLLNGDGCYVGAYLGGNQGQEGPNSFKSANGRPYETQILDSGIPYGNVNTGMTAFRSQAGQKNILFSRYVGLHVATFDDDYEKIVSKRSPTIARWAEEVIAKGCVPVIVLDPWAFADKNGILDLSLPGPWPGEYGGSGRSALAIFAKQLDDVSKRYPDKGSYSTILIVFGQEFESHDEANPPKDNNTNGIHQKAFRRMFREAYEIVHANANENIQVVWAGNTADTWESKKWWWPGFDDGMNALPKDYVDWVGQTRYHSSRAQLLSDMKDYYKFYSEDRGHPYILTETAGEIPASGTQMEMSEDWISKLYKPDLLRRDFRNIKAIIWFDVAKKEGGRDKNFLIPDGVWADNGADTPGQVQSHSNPGEMMLDLYPNAISDGYFLAPTMGESEKTSSYQMETVGGTSSIIQAGRDGITAIEYRKAR